MDIQLESFNYTSINEAVNIKATFKKIVKTILDKIKSVLTKCVETIRKLCSKHNNKKQESVPTPQPKSSEPSSEEQTDDEIIENILACPWHMRKYSVIAMDAAIDSVNKHAKSITISNAYPTITEQYMNDMWLIIGGLQRYFFSGVFGIRIYELKEAEDPIAYVWDKLTKVTKQLNVLGIGEMKDDQFMTRLQELANADNEHTLAECMECDIYQDTINTLREHKFRMPTADAIVDIALTNHMMLSETNIQSDMKNIEAGAVKFANSLDTESVEAADAIKQVMDKWCAVVTIVATYYIKIISSIRNVGITYAKLVNDTIVELMKHDKDIRHKIVEMYRSNPVKESTSFCMIH